jgi:hypothetical protein
MAKPVELQRQFARMERDLPRNALRDGSAWNIVDYIPSHDAALRGRGGWTNASNDIAATTATAAYVIGGIYANYTAGATLIAFDEDGRLYKIASNGTVTDVGASRVIGQNPIMHRDKVIVTDGSGANAPQKVTNSAGTLTIASLGGSPPSAFYSTLFEDRTVLARTTANNNRIWFSDPGDPEGWDTTNTWWDFTLPITGVTSLRRQILVFHDEAISRLVGSTPPPGSDFDAADPLFHVGCSDAKSIATTDDRVLFANPEGIFITDGSAKPANLALLCGMQKYWRELLSAYASTWTISGAVYQNHYFFCVMDGSTFKDAGMINLDRLSWLRLSNVDARAMWTGEAQTDKLYFGRRGAARVGELSSIFQPAAGVKNDGDGDAVAPVFESAYYEGKLGEKAFKTFLLGYELTDYATDNPTLSAGYIKTPEDTSYTALTGTAAENSKRGYKRWPLGFGADGIAFQVTKANAGDVKLWSLEADVHGREQSRRAA